MQATRNISIALVESDGCSSISLRGVLDRKGHASVLYDCVTDFISALRDGRKFDLVMMIGQRLLDWELLPATLETPVLLVAEELIWNCSSAGTNEYLQANHVVDIVPASLREDELDWRIHALRQRASLAAERIAKKADEIWGEYRFTPEVHALSFRAKNIRLSIREYELALLLFRCVNRLLKREVLLDFLKLDASSRTVDVYMSRLRRDLELHAENGFELRTVRGLGYQLLSTHDTDSAYASAPR